MLLVFVLGVRLAAAARGYLARYAPSNVVIDHARAAQPQWRWAAALGALGVVLLVVSRLFAAAVEAGAPPWLNVVVLVTGWDGLKFGWHAVGIAMRRVVARLRPRAATGGGPDGVTSGAATL